jgi:hypothetical protein
LNAKTAGRAKRPWEIVRTSDGTVVDAIYGTPQEAGAYADAWAESEGSRHEARRIAQRILEVAG